MKIAIVHDWLYIFGGAERVLSAMLKAYPDADVYCLFDKLSDIDREKIGLKATTTSFIQNLPMVHKHHRLYLPLMPLAIEQFDLSKYDLIITSSYAVAKGVITGPDQFHVSYIHSPIRYAWDMQHEYLKEGGKGLAGAFARYLLHKIRIWDVRTSHGPNVVIANSRYIGRRIHKAYGRDSHIIYPPVRIPEINETIKIDKHNFFLTASRLVPYKNIHIIAEAFTKYLPDERLVIAGDGPEKERIKAVSGSNVNLVGFLSDAELGVLMTDAKAFIFAAEEDFGIVPVEAQSYGTPVIALGKGGVRETVVVTGDKQTGIFFEEPTTEAITAAVKQFLKNQQDFQSVNARSNALQFSEQRFINQLQIYVEEQYALFKSRQ